MAQDQPAGHSQLTEWRGLKSNQNPTDWRDGAADQCNLSTNVPGVLSVRQGMVLASFEDGGSASTNDIMSVGTIIRPEASWILYLDSAGNLLAGKSPTFS